MPDPTQIELYIKRNGGAPETGVVTAAYSDAVVLSLGSFSTLAKKVKYRIRAYPPGFPCPAGWTTEGVFYTLTKQNGSDAPSFSLPALISDQWGKFIFDAEINDGLVSGARSATTYAKARLKIPSDSGIEDIAYLEEDEFDSSFKWHRSLQDMVRRYNGTIPGSGDVSGDTASVSGNIARFQGPGGKDIRDAGISCTDLFANFNVKMAAYGASPSKLAAQNTAAIKAAIAAIKSAGAGLAYIPESLGAQYLLAQDSNNVALDLTDLQNITIQGAGVGATYIKIGNGENSNVFNIEGTAKNVTIRGMTLDGNRAGNDPVTYGTHGIRCTGVDGLRLEDLEILNTNSYGIGLQYYEKKFIFLNRLRIFGTGSDAIDVKNLGDGNRQMDATSIHVENFGLNGFETAQAGFDCRGAWQVKGFTARFTKSDGVGFRTRHGQPGDLSAGEGGHRTHLSDFEIYAPGGTSLGLELVARDVAVSQGYIKGAFYGIANEGASVTETGDRTTVDGVTVEAATNTAFITSVNADYVTFQRCTAVGGPTGFRARSKGVTFNACRGFDQTAAAFNTDTAGVECQIIAPTVRGVGGSSMIGIDLEAVDCKVSNGIVSGCYRGIVVGAARASLDNVTSKSNTDAGILAAVGGDDLQVLNCNVLSNGTRGVHTRAARTTVTRGMITGSGGAGFLTEATASDAVCDRPVMSGNAADYDDNGTNTTIIRRGVVASLLNQAVAASGTSPNLDVPIQSYTATLFLVEVHSEDNSGTPVRCTLRKKIECVRSASGAPMGSTGGSTPTVVDDFSSGALTLSATFSGNNLRLSVTNGGNNCRLDIRVRELDRSKTLEFS